MQYSNSLGATPSMDKMFGCFARLQIMISLQYFWTKNNRSNLDPAVEGETTYLVDLVGRVLFVRAKRLDGERPIGIFLIGELPNIGESSRREWPYARPAERERDRGGSWKDPMQTTCLA